MADGYISILLAGEVSPYERLSMKSFVDMTGLIDAYGLSSGIFAPGVSYPISSADALHLLIPSRDLQQSMLEAAHEDIEFLRRRYLGAMGKPAICAGTVGHMPMGPVILGSMQSVRSESPFDS